MYPAGNFFLILKEILDRFTSWGQGHDRYTRQVWKSQTKQTVEGCSAGVAPEMKRGYSLNLKTYEWGQLLSEKAPKMKTADGLDVTWENGGKYN